MLKCLQCTDKPRWFKSQKALSNHIAAKHLNETGPTLIQIGKRIFKEIMKV